MLRSAVLLLIAAPAFADYSPPIFRQLVFGADAIVEGTITNPSAGPDSFTLKLRSVVRGPSMGPEIQIRKFQDWTCARRWEPYAAGQETLYFLTKGEKGEWQIMSAGGEGEMPIVDGQVFTKYRELALTPMAKQRVHGAEYYGAKTDVSDVKTALNAALGCFTPTVSKDRWKRVEAVSLVCSAEARANAERAPLTAAVFEVLLAK